MTQINLQLESQSMEEGKYTRTLVLNGNALMPISNSMVFCTANKAVAVDRTSSASIATG